MTRALALSLLVTGCASVTVPPGHAAVVTDSDGLEPQALGEGVHSLGPWAQVQDFDLRERTANMRFQTVAADGSTLQASASAVTFRPARGELVALAREESPDFANTLVRPYLESAVRRVLGRLNAFELDSAHLRRAQAEILAFAAPRLRAHHVVLESLDLKGVQVVSTPTYQAVLDTESQAEQVRAAPAQLDLARTRASALRSEAQGLADSNEALAPTLTGPVLRSRRNHAWARLLSAPSTRVVEARANPTSLEVNP